MCCMKSYVHVGSHRGREVECTLCGAKSEYYFFNT